MLFQCLVRRFHKVSNMLNGTTLGCFFFALGVVGLMITDSKQWLYLGFGIAVVVMGAGHRVRKEDETRETEKLLLEL